MGSVKHILISENNVEGVLYETFSVEDQRFGEMFVVDLKPNGRNIDVDESNKREYVQLKSEWYISLRVKSQMQAFQEGLFEMVPQALIAVFDEREIEVVLYLNSC